MPSWDLAGRAGNVDFRGYELDVTELAYKGENRVVYEDNGVIIRSLPAIHSIDGSVSCSLEWNDLKFVFCSDTYPDKWFDEYARDADLVVHECSVAMPELVSKMRFTPEPALQVGTQIHTAPEVFGKIMSSIKPRMAVACQFFNDFDTANSIYERVRTTYDGPLVLADDFMVWNVTKDNTRVRMAVTEERTWAPPLAAPPELPNMADREGYSRRIGIPVEAIGYAEFTAGATWSVEDVVRPIYREFDMPYPEGK